MEADVDGKMLKVFVHNWDEEYCLKYHPSYKNQDDNFKNIGSSNDFYNKGPAAQLKEENLFVLHSVQTTTS